MSTTTPVLGLTLYDSTTDQAVLFATFRAVWGGTATTSNFYKIDTAVGTIQTNITALQNTRGAIPVSAVFISANYYEATVASITSYITGMTILLKLDTTSAGTVTLKINALDTKSVTKVNSSGTIVNIAGGELSEERYYLLTYDGTQWVWVNAMSGDQIYVTSGTSGNVVTVGSDLSLVGTTTPSALLSTTINGATAKTTPIDTDLVGLVDSADSNTLKKLSWTNIKATLISSWGVLLNGLTAKTTPVGADIIGIADSANSNATKKVTLSNLYKGLGTGTQNGSTFLNGGGTYSYIGANTPYQLSVTVSSNNLTVALKTDAGTDPSTSDPVRIQIGGSLQSITSALSVTKNAGTNWCSSGSTELAAKEVDYFVYLGYNSTDGVVIGFSRIPYAGTYGNFSTTSNNEKYCAISNITNAISSDSYENIGRFSATLSSGGYTWTVPTFTSSNLINHPIISTDWKDFLSVLTGFSTDPATNVYQYLIDYKTIHISFRQVTDGTSNATSFTGTLPLVSATKTNGLWFSFSFLTNSGTVEMGYCYVQSASNTIVFQRSPVAAFTASGGKRANTQTQYDIS